MTKGNNSGKASQVKYLGHSCAIPGPYLSHTWAMRSHDNGW